MKRPEPVLIGFFPKKTAHRDDWIKNHTVEEICSVSICISKGPDDWIDHWKHNTTWWLFDTEEAAEGILGDARDEYDMYAYRLYPVVFDGAHATMIEIDATATGSMGGFAFLGYDMVSRSGNTNFECSPLSCNNGCEQYPVNQYCLVAQLEDAWRITQEIARDSKEKQAWEPGPYFLLEVHRKRKHNPNFSPAFGCNSR